MINFVTHDLHDSVAPDGVSEFGAALTPSGKIVASWKAPTSGGPVDGYKLHYWRQASVDEDVVELPRDVS